MNIKIAAAQIYSVKGDIEANIKIHLKVLETAYQHKVDFIIFPELSLTGYELELAENLAVDINDEQLLPLAKAAEEYNITIAAGMPIKSDSLPKLGLILFSPNGDKTTYYKMNVHTSEDKYFSKGDEFKIVKIKNEKIGLSICADINNSNHIEEYSKLGATVYASSVLISENAYQSEIEVLHKNGTKLNLPILVSNHSKPTGKYIPAGKSGVFLPDESYLTVQKEDASIIILEKKSEKWQTSIIDVTL